MKGRVMQTIGMDKDELFSQIKKAVHGVIQEEMGKVWLEGPPTVSDQEKADINRRFGKPERTEKIESRKIVDI